MHDPATAQTDTADAKDSKTRRKQVMHDLQDLGAALTALDPPKLAELDLPERLADAIALARTIRKHEARRRQLQFIGRLMRDVDPAPIAAALARWSRGSRAEKARFAAVEGWRERLLADDAALAELIRAHPAADRSRITALVDAARRERATGSTPRQFRELFRQLQATLATTRGESSHDPSALPEADC
jgi:ribosome-associated protein